MRRKKRWKTWLELIFSNFLNCIHTFLPFDNLFCAPLLSCAPAHAIKKVKSLQNYSEPEMYFSSFSPGMIYATISRLYGSEREREREREREKEAAAAG